MARVAAPCCMPSTNKRLQVQLPTLVKTSSATEESPRYLITRRSVADAPRPLLIDQKESSTSCPVAREPP